MNKVVKFFPLLSVVVFCAMGCAKSIDAAKQSKKQHDMHSNRLVKESSPYLLQHAYNPVDWYPWGEEALSKAKEENKLLLISVGYSACHWCHVMERESFEDSAVAAIMNEHFVCVKVDREERPDVDQVYMSAVQLMTGRGGWPLNCFALPDGRPVFGGTYFPKENWSKLLQELSTSYQNTPEKFTEYAEKLHEGIQRQDVLVKIENEVTFDRDVLKRGVDQMEESFDQTWGGLNRSPKFPVPSYYNFLLEHAYYMNNQRIEDFVMLTLDQLCRGGIYDQIGGGFARYSTDIKWKVPHFEKMLYDNAQLMSLYAKAYARTKSPEYLAVLEETLTFLEREMKDPSGLYYAALDADSEGEEGLFYIWTKPELKEVLGEDYGFAKDFYNINLEGYWENEHYILLRRSSLSEFAESKNLPLEELQKKVKYIDDKLMSRRDKRVRPGLDDKCLTAWNALLLKGLSEAYWYTKLPKFKRAADGLFVALKEQVELKDKKVWHTYKKGERKIDGFLDDYATFAEACLSYYQISLNEEGVRLAEQLVEWIQVSFQAKDSPLYAYTDGRSEALIVQKIEVEDDVIPASNSVLAHVLMTLGEITGKEMYKKEAGEMLKQVYAKLEEQSYWYANWASLMFRFTEEQAQLAVVGKDAEILLAECPYGYAPELRYYGCASPSEMETLVDKWIKGDTYIYLCKEKTCELPVDKWENVKERK